jgi:hypothetical protein
MLRITFHVHSNRKEFNIKSSEQLLQLRHSQYTRQDSEGCIVTFTLNNCGLIFYLVTEFTFHHEA